MKQSVCARNWTVFISFFYLWSTTMSNWHSRSKQWVTYTRDRSLPRMRLLCMPEHVDASRAGCCECNRLLVLCLKTSMYRHKPQGLIWFCLCMFVFFTLKAVGPIDCSFMTDRLQWFELLKIFVCVLLKKQSHLHLGCCGGKQVNIIFSFLGELFL